MKLHGITVSVTVVQKLLKKHGYVKRQAQKKQTTKITNNRNQQFENLATITEEYELQGNSIIIMDTKKRNLLEINIAQ
ncbi:ISAzo13-like element transposase-related protein [Microcoleus sp. N9_A1]|uniref:ISAzo13-like element transposase-related protein n=1 Tax=Microcoleus sp. N9_A1 TaxID=3055380 RepID=UPI002FD67709